MFCFEFLFLEGDIDDDDGDGDGGDIKSNFLVLTLFSFLTLNCFAYCFINTHFRSYTNILYVHSYSFVLL